MKKLLLSALFLIFLVSISSAIKFSKDITPQTITSKNQTKLEDTYGKTFDTITKFNSYKTNGNIAIINVSIGNKYARLITNKGKLEEVLK